LPCAAAGAMPVSDAASSTPPATNAMVLRIIESSL
jgi:hypothetical protein